MWTSHKHMSLGCSLVTCDGEAAVQVAGECCVGAARVLAVQSACDKVATAVLNLWV